MAGITKKELEERNNEVLGQLVLAQDKIKQLEAAEARLADQLQVSRVQEQTIRRLRTCLDASRSVCIANRKYAAYLRDLCVAAGIFDLGDVGQSEEGDFAQTV